MASLVHVVVNVQYSTLSGFGGTAQAYGIAANFSINGANTGSDYKYLFTSSATYSVSGWDKLGYLNVFPTMEIGYPVIGTPGNVYYIALYNEVHHLYYLQYSSSVVNV